MSDLLKENTIEYVSFKIGDQDFGLDVLSVRDVFHPTKITKVLKCRPEVYGVLNLRGRIVTVIDMRRRLGLPSLHEHNEEVMNIVVEYGEESYALMVDSVGDVMSLSKETFEDVPSTMDRSWASISQGIHRLEKGLIIILDVNKTMGFLEDSNGTLQFS